MSACVPFVIAFTLHFVQSSTFQQRSIDRSFVRVCMLFIHFKEMIGVPTICFHVVDFLSTISETLKIKSNRIETVGLHEIEINNGAAY